MLAGVVNAQANRPGSEEGLKCAQADADIFDALFCKWGRDEEVRVWVAGWASRLWGKQTRRCDLLACEAAYQSFLQQSHALQHGYAYPGSGCDLHSAIGSLALL